MGHWSLFLGAVLMLSCNAVKVTYDYDREADFISYATYGVHPDKETGLSELDEKRLYDILDHELQSKGLRFAEDPDILVYVSSTVLYNNAPNSTVGVGMGGTGGHIGGGVSVGVPLNSSRPRRQIRFDFVDAPKDALVWQAIASQSFSENGSPEQREAQLQKIVSEVFSKYPPKQK